MSKAKANAILKDHGLEFVKMSTGSMFDNGKCYTDESGKRVQGIYASCTGPLTVTDAHLEHQRGVVQKVMQELLQQFPLNDCGEFIITSSARTTTTLSLRMQDFPAYTHSAGLDRAYKNQYLVPVYTTSTIDTTAETC